MDAPAPLSQSRVWALQRAFYEDNANEAFAEIPHQIVDNPFVAAAFARVVVGYLRDCARGGLDLNEPLYIVDPDKKKVIADVQSWGAVPAP